MDPYRVIKRPRVSEKAHQYIEESNTYVFEVDRDANKDDIKAAIEKIWNVQVKGVRTVNVKGKPRRFGRTEGRTSAWKKALVRLAEGQAIDALR